jgi:hypothetical protein
VQRAWERRIYGCGRSNGGAERLGRVTVGWARRDDVALGGLTGRQRGELGPGAMAAGVRQYLGVLV